MKKSFTETTVFIQNKDLIEELIERKAIEINKSKNLVDSIFGCPVILDKDMPKDEVHIVGSNGKRHVFKITNNERKIG